MSAGTLEALASGNWVGLAPCLVGAAVLLAALFALSTLRRRPLPGKLKPRGTFESEDPMSKDAIDERKRDFSRIVATRRDLWIWTDSERRPGTVIPIEPADGVAAEQVGQVCYNRLKFWLQGELGKIPGAVDLGATSQWQVVDRVVYFISASPGFDFVMRHKVHPMLLQCKFMIFVSKSAQVRVAWYAFATDKIVPGSTSGPFVIKLVSEDLRAERGSRSHAEFRYTATQTSERDMEQLISKHKGLIARGIDSDDWEPYLKM
eukprot:CAMPEP_0203898134 /NCGR_PEP_ID=MMETSP0359-20131031/40705_1 /ASSEMBLY_ACC=CAM_ASM_000338 /TAXON_ID=268821 /ORGANISM="Scrippsiella Hangoei, Strain SHTV-5" /LENGTH=261 /DNA_ID=CAMNT_0050821151 /DNA_START=45 /DNA_END=830 /DNA_ORIENTATION=-